MPPKKRRTGGGAVEHHGRTTTRALDESTVPAALRRSVAEERLDAPRSARGSAAVPVTPAPTKRYTPPMRMIRFRPGWHKAVGAMVLVVGLTVIVLNDLKMLGAPRTVLPGGHTELYFMLGLAIAGYSTWWFGWFDRTR